MFFLSKNRIEIPADIKDVVYNTAIRTGSSEEWDFLVKKFKTTKVDSDRQKYLSAISATEDQITLRKLLNMTIYRDESGIRLQDCVYIYRYIPAIYFVSLNSEFTGWLLNNGPQ